LSLLDGFRGSALVVQADPCLRELVGLPPHIGRNDGKVLWDRHADTPEDFLSSVCYKGDDLT